MRVSRSSLAMPCELKAAREVLGTITSNYFSMSKIYTSALIAVLAQVLPHLGVTIGNEELTGFITTGVTIGAPLGS